MLAVMAAAVVALVLTLLGVAAEIARSHGWDAFQVSFNGYRWSVASADAHGGGAVGKARQTQTVITGLVIVITASLAVIVVDRFDRSLGTPQSSQLSTAQNDVLSGFSDMVSLIGPLLLVLIAVVIVGVVQRLRAN